MTPAPGGAVPRGGHAKARKEQRGCEVTDLFRLLGKAYVLDLLYIFLNSQGPRRFVEVQEELGISPNTLSERLREMVEAGFLTRTAYNEIPPRVDYAATPKLAELEPVFRNLSDWTTRNNLGPEAAAQPAQREKRARA